MKKMLFTLLLTLLLGFLLLSPQTALEAASNGLILWYRNLVPVLLPFLILSNLMIRLDVISALLKYIHPLFRLLWGTSVYGSYGILAGFLFGYPLGAKVVQDLRQEGLISLEEATYLIGFINNLSPAFLITFVANQSLQQPSLAGPTLAILYGSSILTGLLTSFRYRNKKNMPPYQKKKASKAPLKPELIDACISDGILNITKLGVYIMLFSIITGALSMIPIKNPLQRCLLLGSLEITAGIRMTCASSMPFAQKYLCLILLCSFGGICALFQTLSVFPMPEKTFRHYLKAKALTLSLSVLFTWLFLAKLL
ncbi:MAG: hypothetical protein Q4E91_07595 [Lachnospiraceae bacterium]|nr:hypothetical protein [Lachnospiraceae bacterium]